MVQNNKTNANSQNASKRILLETIDFIRSKVENDTLTAGECASLANVVAQSLELCGTVDDFARFFGKSPNNVKVVICRKMTTPPFRSVLYPFDKFCRVIPETWRESREKKQEVTSN